MIAAAAALYLGFISHNILEKARAVFGLWLRLLCNTFVFFFGRTYKNVGPQTFVFIAVQHRMLTNFSVITYLNATLHALSCSYSVGKKKVKSKHTYWHQNCDESVKKKNQFSEFDFAQRLQQTCYESIWSRSIRHPSYNVLVPALRFFFFYLVQSHFVVFQPLPSHILCLWLSLDFSQTDKLISFIHTWSFFSFITTSWFFLFFPPWHPSSLPVGWP